MNAFLENLKLPICLLELFFTTIFFVVVVVVVVVVVIIIKIYHLNSPAHVCAHFYTHLPEIKHC